MNFNINETKMKERPGREDGYALTVFYGTDIHHKPEDGKRYRFSRNQSRQIAGENAAKALK